MSGRIPYKQMFAQAVTELYNPDCVYWFTSEDERSIQEHNRQYQDSSSLEQVLQNLFEPSKIRRKAFFWQVQAIQEELSKRLKSSDVPSLKTLGETIKKLHWPHGGIDGAKGYYLRLKS